MNEDIYTKFEEELYITGVYAKIITRQNLSLDYHKKVGGLLYDAAEKGFSGSLEHFSPFTAQYKTLRGLRSNIYIFSAAKQYQQVREMSRFINVKGVQSTFSDFKVKAGKVFDDYNKNYLKVEYVTAISAAQNAREWVEAVQKADVFPLMRYETQRDLRVRDEHRKLDGVTLPINHPFWNNYMPPNGWNCFMPDTKILTKKGWVRIDTINPNTKVIGGSGEEKEVNFVHINPFKGTLVGVKVDEGFIFCTDNHRFLTLRGWIMAKNLIVSDQIVQIKMDQSIANVDNIHMVANDIKPIKSHWPADTFENLNPDFMRGNKNVNPMVRNIIIMLVLKLKGINYNLLRFSWFYARQHMNVWMRFIKTITTNFSLSNNLRSMEGGGNTEFSSNQWALHAFHWMGVFLKELFEKLSTTYRGFISSFDIINPLHFYGFATSTRSDIVFAHKVDDLPRLQSPSSAKFTITEPLLNVKPMEGFTNGAPLDSFDSLECFRQKIIRTHDLKEVKCITNIRYSGNVYNLEIEKDQSYITEVGITHNCRCFTTSQEDEPIIRPSKEAQADMKDETKFPPLFQMNPGKDEIIFDPAKHPYFKVARGDKDLKLKNFNLPVPQ